MEYKIVSSSGSCALERKVNHYLSLGWEIKGGVSISRTDYKFTILQAMIKENKEEEHSTIKNNDYLTSYTVYLDKILLV